MVNKKTKAIIVVHCEDPCDLDEIKKITRGTKIKIMKMLHIALVANIKIKILDQFLILHVFHFTTKHLTSGDEVICCKD